MQQIKLFKGIESELSDLQGQINDWIRTENVNVINMFGNIAPQTVSPDASSSRQFMPSDILISVLYDAP